MTNLEKLCIKQGQQIEALEWFFEYVDSTSTPSVEGAIDKLDHFGVKSHKAQLIKLWEKQNDMKWRED